MHILVVPLPVHGHVNPMLHLSMHLASMGHKVTFVTTTSTRARAIDGLSSMADAYCNLRLEALPDEETTSGYGLKESILFMERSSEQMERLVQRCTQHHGRPISFKVVDFLLLHSLRQTIGGATIPTAAFWTSSAGMMLVSMNIHRLFERGYLPLDKSRNKHNLDIDSCTIPGIPFKLSLCKDIPEDPVDPTYKSMRSIRPLLLDASTVLINTFDALEQHTLQVLKQDGFNVVPVGPLVEATSWSSESELIMEWLNKHEPRSVLYLSFGTMHQASTEQMEEIGHALESIQRPFLWTLKEATPLFLEDLERRIKGRGMVVGWTPQQQVLSHPSVGAFVTHCGWNSTLEAAASGVPMVAWPQVGDQFINSKCVESMGLGTRLEAKDENGCLRSVGREEIRNAIDLVMGDEQVSQRATAMRAASKISKDELVATLHKLITAGETSG